MTQKMLEPISERIPEVENEPLDDHVIDFLIDHDGEESYLDFKESISIGRDYPFSELAKDMLAFLNYGGGFVLVGFREKSKSTLEEDKKSKRQYIPVGLPDEFHVDQADLQTKYNSYCVHPITILYREFQRNLGNGERKFAIIYFPASTELIKAARSGTYVDKQGRNRTPFLVGWILYRRGTQSVPATKEEIAFIQQRTLNTQYKLSILSGRPDRIKETIFSNLFETSVAENTIFTGLPRKQPYGYGSPSRIPNEYVFKSWGTMDVTFETLDDPWNPLWGRVVTESIERHKVSEWLPDEDKSRVVIGLLNKEFGFLARRIGLLRLEDEDRYYFQCDGESRKVSWKPRFRESSELTVAKKTPIPKLKRDAYIHLAVNTGFIHFDNRIYLGLFPTLMLTADGRNPTTGEKEGAVLTSLLHNRYNQAFLNDLLFWIQQFSCGQDKISLAHGRISVASRPTESIMGVGILSDRPVSEGVPEPSKMEVSP